MSLFGKKNAKPRGEHDGSALSQTAAMPPVDSEEGQNPEGAGEGKTTVKKQGFDFRHPFAKAKVATTSNPKDWNFRAELIPRSVVRRNHDRVVRNGLVVVDMVVAALCIAAIVLMSVLVNQADKRTTAAQDQYTQLVQKKAQFKDVEDTLNSVDDEQLVKIGVLYNEVDWNKVAGEFNSALPANGKYESLDFSEYQLASATGKGSSASSTAGTVWSNGGVITVDFTVTDPDFIKAHDFIANFEGVTGYINGSLTSITGGSDAGYTYTGSVTLHLIVDNADGSQSKNTTERSDNSAGADDSKRQLLATMRESLESEAAGLSTTSTSTASTSGSSDSE